MTLIGFVGFLDPPKESAKGALEALRSHGIRTVVLTGDAPGVARYVCDQLGINTDKVITGAMVEAMSDDELQSASKECCLFSKLNPYQKKRVVSMIQKNGHTVGYMGDGINDAPSLKQANVGISVDSAVDIAKEVADIILLDKDLNVLDEGVMGGRKTFANLSKYIKMATSGNFGNMFSVVLASIFLPFLPLMPEHILVQNLLNDFAQLGMPWDNVDAKYLQSPKKINTKSLRTYMLWFGIASTVEDILCFLILWFVFKYNTMDKAVYFQTGWLLFGTLSQTFIIHIIRTEKIPFIQDRASLALRISTIVIMAITVIIGFTSLARLLTLATMPLSYGLWLILLILIYTAIVQILKPLYIKKYGSWV